jgi:hypothetical protein
MLEEKLSSRNEQSRIEVNPGWARTERAQNTDRFATRALYPNTNWVSRGGRSASLVFFTAQRTHALAIWMCRN